MLFVTLIFIIFLCWRSVIRYRKLFNPFTLSIQYSLLFIVIPQIILILLDAGEDSILSDFVIAISVFFIYIGSFLKLPLLKVYPFKNNRLIITFTFILLLILSIPLIPHLLNFGLSFRGLREFYEYLELPSLLRELNKLKPQAEVYNMSYRVIDNPIDINDALDDNSSLILESSEYNYHRANLLYIGLKNKKGNFIILPDLLYQSIDLQLFMADKENHKSIYDYKRAYVLLKKMGFELNGVDFDMLLGAYVLNPSITKNEFKMVASSFNYYKLRFDEEVYGKGVKRSIPEPSLLMEHVISKVECLYLIKNQIISSLKENDQYDLLTQIEIPLSRVLGKMEFEGIKVDLNELNLQKKDLEERINFIESEIFRLAGETFNISSPKQLGVVLFEHLGLPSSKKTKTGYSTDQSALEEVKHLHPVVEYILNYRMLTKLYQTYIIGLNEQIFADEKCHTIYEQALTPTGRLSSIEPNLQNIPIRTEQGRLIRKMFIPSNKNNCFFSADYSQIELRVLAHLANVKKLIEAFNANLDIHSQTAREIFGHDDISPEERRKAKAVNFGIIYGISAYGLATDIGISNSMASDYIKRHNRPRDNS